MDTITYNYKGTKLLCPAGYLKLTEQQKKEICNGAGAKGYGWTVPDTFYFLSITEAANIHDYMYFIGKTLEDKVLADQTFLFNMIEIIESQTTKIFGLRYLLLWLRRERAIKYYSAVRDFGEAAFRDGKEDSQCS